MHRRFTYQLPLLIAASSVVAPAQLGYSAIHDFLSANTAQTQPQKPPERLPGEQKRQISDKDAELLFHSIDEIAQWVSDDTGLGQHHPIARQLSSRAEVQQSLEERMNKDEETARLKRAELVLKKFGLLPRDFDLGPFLVKLLREQIIGFYDPEKKTIFLLDWVDSLSQKPVLAHELTHALQDQTVDLRTWLRAEDPGSTEFQARPEPPPESRFDPDRDERRAARDAVLEGQATVAALDYTLFPFQRTALNSPQIVADNFDKMVDAHSKIFSGAPLYIKELLTFPYRYGMRFELAVLAKGGRKQAYVDVLRSPPINTRQILEPDTYLKHEAPISLGGVDIASLLAPEYTVFDSGSMGEFDIKVLAEHFAKQGTAEHLAHAWRGGWYVAVLPSNSDPSAPELSQLGLIYRSRWDSPKNAAQFLQVYRKSLERKYGAPKQDLCQELSAGVRCEWTNARVRATISVHGDYVLVTEDIALEMAHRLAEHILRTLPPAPAN
jgi:hypothetical protein